MNWAGGAEMVSGFGGAVSPSSLEVIWSIHEAPWSAALVTSSYTAADCKNNNRIYYTSLLVCKLNRRVCKQKFLIGTESESGKKKLFAVGIFSIFK